MTIQSSTKTRSQAWEDEALAEPRFRRVQQGVPPTGRVLPGMPLEMTDPDDDDSPRPGGRRRDWSGRDGINRPWWRPAGTVGRVLLSLCALTVLGGIATASYLLKTYIGRDARFRVAGAGNIEATGLTEVSRAEMLPVFGEDIGRNIFFVPLAERRKQLEQIPWIERATVMRVLPDQIRVSVVERQPVAFVRQGQQIGLVDASGVLLSMPAALMAQHHYSFPVVTGIDAHSALAARKGRMSVYQRLLAELDANNQHLSEQISEIDLTDPEDARVLMPEQGADILAHFGDERFLERYQRYKAHIAEWRQQYPKLAAVDLRYDQQVVLEMNPNTNGTDAAAGAEAPATAAESKPPAPAQELKAQANVKPASPGKPEVKTAAKVKQAKSSAKSHGKDASKPKTRLAKDKAAKNKKKLAAAKRAAQSANKRKPTPKTRPAAVARQGQ